MPAARRNISLFKWEPLPAPAELKSICPGFAWANARVVRRVALAVFVLLSALGINALLAFVWTPAQWLAVR